MGLAPYLALVLSIAAATTALVALARARQTERVEARNRREVLAAIGGLRAEVLRAGVLRALPSGRAGRSTPFHLAPAPLPERRLVDVTTDDDPIHTRKTVKMSSPLAPRRVSPVPSGETGDTGDKPPSPSDDDLSDSRETLEVTPAPTGSTRAPDDDVTRAEAKDPRSTILGIGEGASAPPPSFVTPVRTTWYPPKEAGE